MSLQEPSQPKTIDEWRSYVDSLEGEELFDVAAAANGIDFVETLESEGYEPVEIHAILHAFARRFAKLGERPPMNGLYDFLRMARTTDPMREVGSS